MKKLFLILSFIVFTTTYSYCDIDFRNNSESTIKYQSYGEDSNNSETIIKLSVGIYNDIDSKLKNIRWENNKNYYEYMSGYWRYVNSDFSSGKKTISINKSDIIYDLTCEYRYYFYDFFAFGGGIDIPLKKFETIGADVYMVNPYLSFKLKNFLKNFETLDDFYILLNLGTFVPLGHFKNLDCLHIGFDIGIGYEYKNFIFELSYNKHSVDLSDIRYYKDQYSKSYTDSNHYYEYYYYEDFVGNKSNIDITRLKLTVGYKF